MIFATKNTRQPRHLKATGTCQFFIFGCFLIFSIVGSSALAQKRVDLEDLNIKGELLNDNRLRMSSRDPHKISDRVHYRTNFRKEVTDGLEVPWPDKSSTPLGVTK